MMRKARRYTRYERCGDGRIDGSQKGRLAYFIHVFPQTMLPHHAPHALHTQELVRPKGTVRDFRTQLTGLTEKDLKV